MRKVLSKRRFELAALTVAVLMALVHRWAERTPVLAPGVEQQGGASGNAVLRAVHLLEGRLTDLQFILRGPRAPHPDVVVVAVDEDSARRFGLWPWPRDVVAQGIENLREAGARAIGLDMTFTDEVADTRGETLQAALSALQEASGVEVVPAHYRQSLEALRGPSPDERLAQVLAATPQVVHGIFLMNRDELEALGPDASADHAARARRFVQRHVAGRTPGSVREDVSLASVRTFRKAGARMPLAALSEASARVGFMDVEPDPDGTLRRTPLFAFVEGAEGLLGNLELETAAVYFGTRPEPLYDEALDQIVGARLRRGPGDSLVVPALFSEPHALVAHAGPARVFPTVSFADVVDGTFDRSRVEGKAVLVGVTLLGNYDQRVTPFSTFEPGVFIHASMLSNILEGEFLTRPSGLMFVELLFILAAALGLAFVLPRVGFRWKLLAIAGVAGAWGLVDQVLFTRGLQLATLLPLLNVFVTAFVVIFLGYLSADTERQTLAQAFQYRVGPKVMQAMLANPERFKQGGERRELTVLFSDIRGFTSLSERMSPEALTRFINGYLTPMTDIVFETDGTLDKYIGDAVMAFWGAPVDQPDHAERACTAALKMLERLDALKKEWRAQGLPDFDIGVGINSGPMSVGFMGSKIRGDYTVMGDAVNLASRLEGTNKTYETRVLLGEATWALVKDRPFTARRLGAVRVKGKQRPVHIYELRGFGRPQGKDAEAIDRFEAALALYAERRFEEAAVLFREVLVRWPEDPPSLRYLEELERFATEPPGESWDGVYTATTK